MDQNERLLREALRHTEMRLADLQSFGLAADQRALTLAGMNIAIAAVMITLSDASGFPLLAKLAAFGLICSAGVAAFASLPKEFHISGHYYSEWEDHVKNNDDLCLTIESQAKENDVRIIFNEDSLRKTGVFIKTSACISTIIIAILSVFEIIAHLKDHTL